MKSFYSFRLEPGIFKKFPLSDIYLTMLFFIALSIQFLFVLNEFNKFFVIETPLHYGSVNEGIVGVPVRKNPLYATNTVEEDIAALLHVGLLKRTSEGTYIPSLAETWNQEKPNEYTFVLKETAEFHDGFPITTDDVVHTIDMIREISQTNRYTATWSDVHIVAQDNYKVVITVPEGNLNFPEAFTTPILPKHIWKKIIEEQRQGYSGPGVHVGAGPFRYKREEFTLDERPTKLILEGFPNYVLGKPYLEEFVFHFFLNANELLEAYRKGTIDSVHSVSAAEIPALLKQQDKIQSNVYVADTGRVFGIFFNTESDRIFEDSFLRSILSQLVDRESIVTNVFSSRANALQAPIASDKDTVEQSITEEELKQTLEDIGWEFEGSSGQRKKDGVPFEIEFVFPDIEETRQIAEVLTKQWQRLGVVIKARALPKNTERNTILDRNFDAILYGYEARQPKELVALWQSGEKNNLAKITGFDSSKLNTLLAELESTTPPERYQEISPTPVENWHELVYNEIKEEMNRNVPAIFLYSPHFLYILSKEVKGITADTVELGSIRRPSDRLTNVHLWHVRIEEIWKFLLKG